jgi:hypothetical protein
MLCLLGIWLLDTLERFDMYYEFVIEFKNGTRAWIDPVSLDSVTENDDIITVVSDNGHSFDYCKNLVSKYKIREYSPYTTFLKI